MICEDTTHESVLDPNDTFKVELKNDTVQVFNTKRDETIIAMKHLPDMYHAERPSFPP